MAESVHPMDSVMRHTMENLKEMVAVNTILGEPVETPDGSVILPVSRVSFGFAAGGTEFQGAPTGRREERESARREAGRRPPAAAPSAASWG